jgi:hypothetical protein
VCAIMHFWMLRSKEFCVQVNKCQLLYHKVCYGGNTEVAWPVLRLLSKREQLSDISNGILAWVINLPDIYDSLNVKVIDRVVD